MVAAWLLVCLSASAQEEKEKQVIRISLTYNQVNEEIPVLKITAKIKEGKRFTALEGVVINLSFMEDSPEGFIGSVKTNKEGTASMTLPAEIKARVDSLSQFKFIASVTSNDRFDDESTEIDITKARIELSLQEVDSVKTIGAKVMAMQDGKWKEAPETEVKLFVKRLFSDLSVGEDVYTTNENGEVSTEFNVKIPGDPQGNIIIGAKIVDSDMYGTISTTKVVEWGIPLKADNSFSKRTLWATRDKTPLWLLIFPNLIIATVWGFIIYLLYLIGRIRKNGIANRHL
jgi:hypothetical protein